VRIELEAQRVRLQLDRILASAAFADAERACRLLRFVVERTLEGRATEIKESVIAVEVLSRPSSFDSKSDAIVRVEAARLRDRLTAYYQTDGEVDSVLILLPKGRYVPEFVERRPRRSSETVPVLRLSILPPENASFESFAVSPDGRKLAFTAALNGTMMLWVRALDSLEAKPLAGTDNAAWPFWSPDSQSIGFFTPQKLKAVGIIGGPAREIADLVVGRAGAWSSADVILFCPRPIGPLYQIPATGGTASPATSLDEVRAEVAHGFPQFLPGGRQFLYLAASSRPGESSIRVGSLDSNTSKALVSADTSAAYAPILRGQPASLLFVHDGALMAQAFDSQRLELSGERVVVVPQVRHGRWRQCTFSVSNNGVLLYQEAKHQQFSWFDRQGKLLAAVGPPNDCVSFSLSPDERYVALHRHEDPDTVLPTIWVMDLLRENAVFRFTDTDVAQPEFTPVWSPDSREILFSRGDERRMRLFRQTLSGGIAKCMLDTEGPKFPSDWASDGKFVAYTSQVPDYRNLHTWILALSDPEEEAKPHPFLQHSCQQFSAQFSPAGGGEAPLWLAYTSNETGRYEVYVRDFPEGRHKWQVSNQGGLQPHWRHDGRELFYLKLDGRLMSVAVNPGPSFDFGASQSLFTTGLRFLTPYTIWMNQYAVSRDGQRFLLNRSLPERSHDAITAVIPW
jgi:eukaryotic-like serine/threonine-protein kinase